MADSHSNATQPRATTAQWLIAGLLAMIAAGLWLRPGTPLVPEASAQSPALAGARGVFAFTGQIDRDQYGLFMLDVDQGTIWCYAFENHAGARKLKLVAARTWVYDRYLKDFNCAEPTFRDIQNLVKQQRDQSAAEPADPAKPPPGE